MPLLRPKEKEDPKRLAEYENKLRAYESELRRRDDTSRIHMLNPARICPNPSQPRRYFDDEALISLADSIRQYGMIQPLTVRRMSDENTPFGGLYELIAGERRLRAARMLSMPYVPCIIIDADKEESAKLALVENLQRHDLNFFEEADAIGKLCEVYGIKQHEAAAMLSVSQSYIANKLRLLRLGEEERGTVLNGNLTERHVRAALRAEDPAIRKKILQTAALRGYNVKQTEQYALELITDGKQAETCETKFVIKDIRIFLNTIDKAVGIVRRAGIPIEESRSDGDGMIELKIRVPDSRVKPHRSE